MFLGASQGCLSCAITTEHVVPAFVQLHANSNMTQGMLLLPIAKSHTWNEHVCTFATCAQTCNEPRKSPSARSGPCLSSEVTLCMTTRQHCDNNLPRHGRSPSLLQCSLKQPGLDVNATVRSVVQKCHHTKGKYSVRGAATRTKSIKVSTYAPHIKEIFLTETIHTTCMQQSLPWAKQEAYRGPHEHAETSIMQNSSHINKR